VGTLLEVMLHFFVLCLLFASQFLALEKQFGGIHPIAIGEVTYCSVVHTLALQFRDIFAKHFNLH
jgi:hypothetical protein